VKINIVVTADDIANGKPSDLANCPIALAAKRAGFIDEILVIGSSICLWDRINVIKGSAILLPDFVQHWITDFDCRIKIEFEVDAPEMCLSRNENH
jgi:hypothetical protein